MEECKGIIRTFSKDISMEFGLDKCAVLHTEKGKIVEHPQNDDIQALAAAEDYKYLGILQCDNTLHQLVKNKATKEYLNRLRQILHSGLSAPNITTAIATFAVPVLRYTFGSIRWTRRELDSLDRRTRKILTKNGFHHPKSDVDRLYLPRQQGGRGLVNIRGCWLQENQNLAIYLHDNRNDDPHVKLIAQAESRLKRGIMTFYHPPQ